MILKLLVVLVVLASGCAQPVDECRSYPKDGNIIYPCGYTSSSIFERRDLNISHPCNPGTYNYHYDRVPEQVKINCAFDGSRFFTEEQERVRGQTQ